MNQVQTNRLDRQGNERIVGLANPVEVGHYRDSDIAALAGEMSYAFRSA